MTSAIEHTANRYIVVTLDASESGRPALQTAVRLAALLGAGLEGVFVEDINLIRLAGLPFLREVRPWSLADEEISTQRMQRELRTLARRAEQMLERVARETGVQSGHIKPHQGISGSGSGAPRVWPESRQCQRQLELPTISSQHR